MKKIYLSLSIWIFSILFSNAQSWNSLENGINSEVGTFTVFNGNLIAGGGFDSASGVRVDYLAQWDGHSRDSIISNGMEDITAICVYNNELYSTDIYTLAPPILGWNDTIWAAVPLPPTGSPQYFYALIVYNGKLYAGGEYYPVNNICSWDTRSCDTLLGGTNGPVYSLGAFNGNLYVGGSFDLASRMPARNIAAWNGTSWNNAGKGINGPVYALAVFNNNLYAGGAFDSAGGLPAENIAMWNGSNWSPVGFGTSNSVYTLSAYGSVLVAGGVFDTAGGIVCNKIAQWNGSAWSALNGGITGNSVDALYNDSGILYVGGEFTKAGNINANNIARWSSPLGINEIDNKSANVKVYPNPNNGTFTITFHTAQSEESLPIVNVYNVLGEKVLTETLRSAQGDNTIEVRGQPDGIYVYRILSDNGNLLGEGKLIIQK